MEKTNSGIILDKVLKLEIKVRPDQEHYLKIIKNKNSGLETEYWWKCNKDGFITQYEEVTGDTKIEKEWEYDGTNMIYRSKKEIVGGILISDTTDWYRYDTFNREIYHKVYEADVSVGEEKVSRTWTRYDENGNALVYSYDPETALGKIRNFINKKK